ncbi:chitinase [Sporothrix brasiliensis 5110]|uniref:chitinase n=1 Tax=Sporothrix brasiliensis 5110 TaxID=1398154 RepID=A0A0C2F5Q0_9PEZI|nr:chitinase [Sporothrix brasiliensis 5110]KIH94219.1 chitinase [Sporothrix brasiliensis 5110]
MKSLSVATISWLLATQVAAAPAYVKDRDVVLSPSPSSWPNATVPSLSGTGSIPSSTAVPVGGGSSGGFTSSLYFSNGGEIQPNQLPVNKISHVLYAFASIASDGTVSSGSEATDVGSTWSSDSVRGVGSAAAGGYVQQFNTLKKANRHLKVLLSIGGYGQGDVFSAAASTAATRKQFANTTVQLVTDWGFDGADIDWEYIATSEDKANAVLLLKATRDAFDAYAATYAPGYHFLLSFASPAGTDHYQAMDIAGMNTYLDSWNLMAYDYAGSWGTTASHQANVYANPGVAHSTVVNTDTALSYYRSHGVAAHKINLGLPLYGRSFDATGGLGDSYSGVGSGNLGQGVWSYKSLPRPGADEKFDETAVGAYSYDESTQELISYDSPESAYHKAQYIQKNGLGGVFFWEASGDADNERSLVGLFAKQFAQPAGGQNLLSFPTSRYTNIRQGTAVF